MRTAAIVGTGTMGPGISAVLARAGLEVHVYDISSEALEKAKQGIALAEGVLDRLEAPTKGGGSINYHEVLADTVGSADFVIEAVPEKLNLKKKVFEELESLVGEDTILASNTSGIPITNIASACARPGRVIGMHWSNPPHLIPMIEVIPGKETTQEVTDATAELIMRFGYHPVFLQKEIPGFVENRILYAILRECLDLVDQRVIDYKGMDLCVKWGIGYKLAVIGPLELLDMAGLDIYESVAGYLNQDLSDRKDVSDTITDLIAAKNLGMKTGRGIYGYTPEDITVKGGERAGKLVAVRKALS